MSKKNVEKTILQGKIDAKAYVETNGYPEVGMFADKKTLQKFYKQLDTEVLEDWCNIEGWEYKACPEQPSIHRMRVAMAILYKHFPRETKPKKESKYAKYTLEDLVNMAVEHEVCIEETTDERILRMRLIMALRANKVIA